MTGLHIKRKSSEKIDIFFHGSRCVHKARNFSSGGSSMFSPNQFLEEALSSQNGEPQKKKGVHLYRILRTCSTRRFQNHRTVEELIKASTFCMIFSFWFESWFRCIVRIWQGWWLPPKRNNTSSAAAVEAHLMRSRDKTIFAPLGLCNCHPPLFYILPRSIQIYLLDQVPARQKTQTPT